MNDMIKKFVFIVLLILGILKLILISTTGNFLGMVSYSSWMIYVLIVLFLIFIWFFYCFVFKSLYSLKFLLILLVGIAVFVSIIGFSTKAMKIGNSQSANFNGLFHTYRKTDATGSLPSSTSEVAADETATCLFGSGAKAESVAGYVADIFSSEKKEMAVGERRTPTAATSFKLSDFTMEEESSLKETVYFTIYGDADQFIPGVSSAIQLCNASSGKTTSANDLTNYYSSPTTDNTNGVEQNFSWVQAPKVKGKYYIDGVAKFNGGAWKLLDRIEIDFK